MSKNPTKKTAGTKKFPVSLDGELFDFLMSEARVRHGGNRSAAIADFLRDAKERDSQPFGPENALIGDVKQVLRKLSLTYERDEKGVDWVIPELGVGLELKARFGATGEQRLIAAMAYSIGRGRCTEIYIVGGELLSEADRSKLKTLADGFKLAKTHFVGVAELPGVLQKLIAENKKRTK